MSYTLRGRIESRLVAALLPLAVACALAAGLHTWWPLELAGLMIGVGLALDAEVYHRLLPYQPGWLALPLGALELGLVTALALLLDLGAPLGPAIGFFAGSWLLAQALGHAGLPLLRLSYADDGGELGRAAFPALAAAVVGVFAFAGALAWATQPPTVRLAGGVHEGPLRIERAERLLGEPGAVVRGGILVRASDVTIRGVAVVGGENGIDVEDADDVRLEDVSVSGATLDGIHVRGSEVAIRGCHVSSPRGAYAQGIDISFGYHRGPSVVEGCTVVGGREGIVTHSNEAMVVRNRVSRTTLRGISITEMSMGHVERNEVVDALGVGILCGDRSMCVIERNVVADTRPDPASGDAARRGFGILVHFGSQAELDRNAIVASPGGVAALLGSELFARGEMDMHAMTWNAPAYLPGADEPAT